MINSETRVVLSQFAQELSPVFEFSSTPLMITGILFFTVDDGLTGGLSGGSEEPGFRWLGSLGELRPYAFSGRERPR